MFKFKFFTNNSKLNWLSFALSVLACQIGGGTIIGLSELGHEFNFYAIFGGLGFSLGFIFLYFVKKNTEHQNFQTVTQVFKQSYDSNYYIKSLSFLQNISFFLISVGMYVALKNLLYPVLQSKILFYLMWLLIIAVASSGSFRFISRINGIQILIIFCCFDIILFKIFFQNKININYVDFFTLNKTQSFSPVRWFLLPFMFTVIGQDMFMNVINAKSKKDVLIGGLLASFLYTLFCLAIVFIGFLGKMHGLEKTNIIANVVNKLAGQQMGVVFFITIFLAVVTTVNAVLNVCSSMTKNDLNLTFKQRDLTFFIGILVIFVGDKFSEVIYVIHTAYGMASMAIFIPFIVAIMSDNKNKLAAIFASAFGVCGFLYFDIFQKDMFLGDLKALLMSVFAFIFFEIFKPKKLN